MLFLICAFKMHTQTVVWSKGQWLDSAVNKEHVPGKERKIMQNEALFKQWMEDEQHLISSMCVCQGVLKSVWWVLDSSGMEEGPFLCSVCKQTVCALVNTMKSCCWVLCRLCCCLNTNRTPRSPMWLQSREWKPQVQAGYMLRTRETPFINCECLVGPFGMGFKNRRENICNAAAHVSG